MSRSLISNTHFSLNTTPAWQGYAIYTIRLPFHAKEN
jgi:hypothetical protein